ncbi:MAG: hypothetical protein AB7P17_01880 [Nitrospirales bacterium]|nr:hypothetical protein [Nitrospirales bacterium]
MKNLPKTPTKRGRPRKGNPLKSGQSLAPTSSHPRCAKCGSRTVQLEQLEQELLASMSIHCLTCGHYTFIGRPVIRLLKRPNVIIPDSIKRPAAS